MNCAKFKRLIHPYMRSEVSGVLGNEFRWHKHFCDRCREAFVGVESSRPERLLTRQPALSFGKMNGPAANGSALSAVRDTKDDKVFLEGKGPQCLIGFRTDT
jgi:hypothetical protein